MELTAPSGELVFFEPTDFEASMDLSDPTTPAMSLSFAEPIYITPIGLSPVMGDQILAVSSLAPSEGEFPYLADLRVSGAGQGLVDPGRLMTTREQKSRATFECQSTVEIELCRPSPGSETQLKYRIFVGTPMGRDACFDVQSPTGNSSKFDNPVPFPQTSQGATPFRWRGCLQEGTSCYVGFSAGAPSAVQNGGSNIVTNYVLATDLTDEEETLYKRDLLPGLKTVALAPCLPPPNNIQICDDELNGIFSDDFECENLDKWSDVVGGMMER